MVFYFNLRQRLQSRETNVNKQLSRKLNTRYKSNILLITWCGFLRGPFYFSRTKPRPTKSCDISRNATEWHDAGPRPGEARPRATHFKFPHCDIRPLHSENLKCWRERPRWKQKHTNAHVQMENTRRHSTKLSAETRPETVYAALHNALYWIIQDFVL